MIRRLGFLVFLACGGIFLYPLKWLLMGTRAGRERRRMIRQQRKLLKQARP